MAMDIPVLIHVVVVSAKIKTGMAKCGRVER
jgi:hypothetical protein